MKFLLALFATLFFALPAWAVDVQMGSNGNLVFEPSEISISAGESVHFVNNMLPPHNVVVEDHPELSHEGLAFAPDFLGQLIKHLLHKTWRCKNLSRLLGSLGALGLIGFASHCLYIYRNKYLC